MLMLWVTKVFHTGPTRVGKLSKNIILPRSIPLPTLAAGIIGVPTGYVVSLFMRPLISWMDPVMTTRLSGLSAVLGGALAVLLVTFQPWRGEGIHTVAAVRASAFASAKTMMCPGSGMPTTRSEDVGTLICCECLRVFSASETFAPPHQWRRRVYVGMQPIPPPVTGEVRIVAGSLPVWERPD